MVEKKYEWTPGPSMMAGLGDKVSGSVKVMFLDSHRANVQTIDGSGDITVRDRTYWVNVQFERDAQGRWVRSRHDFLVGDVHNRTKAIAPTVRESILDACRDAVADLAQPNVLATAQQAHALRTLSHLEDELAVHLKAAKDVRAAMRPLLKEIGA